VVKSLKRISDKCLGRYRYIDLNCWQSCRKVSHVL